MRAWACGLVVGLGLLAGCDKGGSGGEGKFVPAQANAREALEAALNKWKDGQAQPGEIPVGKVEGPGDRPDLGRRAQAPGVTRSPARSRARLARGSST